MSTENLITLSEKPFKRGLADGDGAFIKRLIDEYKKGAANWWNQIINHKELFVGIREEYLNVYYKGCSLVMLELKDGELIGHTHYKYLVHPQGDSPYVRFESGILKDETAFLENVVLHYQNIAEIIKASEFYTGDEAKIVHQILMANAENYLDTEIAFQRIAKKEDSEKEINKQDRIDLALLDEDENGQGKIYFCEVKQVNDSRLYSTKRPEVVDQMLRYYEILNSKGRKSEIIDSYRTVCSNLISIYGNHDRPEDKWLNKLRKFSHKDSILKVFEKPILLIVGEKSEWEKHKKNRVGLGCISLGDDEENKFGIVIGLWDAKDEKDFSLDEIKKAIKTAEANTHTKAANRRQRE